MALRKMYEQYRIGGNEIKFGRVKNVIVIKQNYNRIYPMLYRFCSEAERSSTNDYAKLYGEIGVDEVRFKTAQVYDFENGNPLIPTIEKYARYKQNPNGTYKIKSNLDDNCRKLWHSCVITWNGNVVPCCFDKDAKYAMGM
ncbi:MAG: SPASM domain-containing protein [Bacteroidetes bacterium]|nr:SPASM domain-containing protein [Bacteroidota bacterium]